MVRTRKVATEFERWAHERLKRGPGSQRHFIHLLQDLFFSDEPRTLEMENTKFLLLRLEPEVGDMLKKARQGTYQETILKALWALEERRRSHAAQGPVPYPESLQAQVVARLNRRRSQGH